MVANTYEDRTPDNIYIKVFPARLRQLIREKKLHRAEIAELVLLALRIDENNTCWPSKADSAASIGMASPHWSRKLQKRLKMKGVIDWDFDHDSRSPRFHIPDAFYFGRASYPDHNTESTRDQNADSTWTHNIDSRGDQNADSKEEPHGRRSISEKNNNQQTDSDSVKKAGPPPTPSREQVRLIRDLIDAGVSDLEAYLIPLQYREETINKAIEDSRNNHTLLNPGGWVRRAIERIANRPIEYTGFPPGQLRAAAAMAATTARMIDPYQYNDYFSRHNAFGADNAPDQGDTTYNAGDGDNPDNSGDTTNKRGQRYNGGDGPTDNRLPF